ncbi:MFS transporter [Mycoplasmatota bacterium WC30]
MKTLFSNKSYFLLFQGSLVSAIGTSLYSFAAGLYVQDLFGADGGAVYLSLFMAVGIIIRIVLSPVSGLIADKWNKIRILYVTDFIRGIVFFGTLYILSLGLEKEVLIWYLLGVTAIASINQAFFGPAATSVIPEVVGDDLIQAASGANSIIGSVQGIFGVLAGMFLYAILGFEVAVLINAISFMFSGISEMFIKTHFHKEKPEAFSTVKAFFEDIKFGFKYLVKKEGLLVIMLFSLMLNFAFSPLFGVGIPYLFRTELATSAYELGVVDIVFSVAMLVAGIVVGGMKIKNLRNSIRKSIICLSSSFVFSAILVVLVTYNVIGYWWFYGMFLFANILLAVFMMFTNVPLNTGIMKAIEPNVRGRVFATIGAISEGAIPLAIIAAGFLVDNSNVAILGIVCSVLVIITTIGISTNKKVATLLDSIDVKEKQPIPQPEYV